MLLYPPIDELLSKFDNPYKLAVIVGKRAKYLNKREEFDEEENTKKPKAVTQAILEVYEGKITEQ